MKAGRVVLALGGRYAGRKAVVVKVDLFYFYFERIRIVSKDLIFILTYLSHMMKAQQTSHMHIAW